MDRAHGQPRGSNFRFLILSLLLVTSNVHRTNQQIVTNGCKLSPLDDAPANVNKKILKCNNVSITSVNRDYFKSDSNIVYTEIILKHMKTDDFLNVSQKSKRLKLSSSYIFLSLLR